MSRLAVTHAQPFLLVTRQTVQFNAASNHILDVSQFLAALENGELETAVALLKELKGMQLSGNDD